MKYAFVLMTICFCVFHYGSVAEHPALGHAVIGAENP